MYRKIYIFLLFLFTLCTICLFYFHVYILNFLAEKSFLSYHNNTLAINILEKISDKYKNERSFLLLGRLYFVENNLYEAGLKFSAGIKLCEKFEFEKMNLQTNAEIEKINTCKQMYYGRGLVNGFSGAAFLEQAKLDFLKNIELENIKKEKTGENSFGAWAGCNDLAWIYFLEGDFENAQRYSRLGLDISPSNPWLYTILGVSLANMDKCKEAKSILEAAAFSMKEVNTEEFGQAYSGDNNNFWQMGKEQMQKSINENLEICRDKQNL